MSAFASPDSAPAAASPANSSSATGAALAIEAQGVCKKFGARLAVDRVHLRVSVGSTYGLIGLNGAGKSTLIRMLVGILPPSRGVVRLGGIDVGLERMAAVSVLGYVPDRPNVYPWMRVSQAMAFGATLWPTWDDALAAALRKQYRLDPDQRCGKLSKGQGAKLSLLMALAHKPSILILDEPTDGLDPVAREDFLEQVLASGMDSQGGAGATAGAARTILISSHSLADVERLADTIGLMHEGTLAVQGPTEELLASTKRLRTVLENEPAGGVGAGPTPPEGTIYHVVRGREWTLTVRGADEARVEHVRRVSGSEVVEVSGVSLDDLFKDFVRGRRRAEEIQR